MNHIQHRAVLTVRSISYVVIKTMISRQVCSLSVLIGLLSVGLIPGIAKADIPGKHPHLLHARSDLRRAETLLKQPDEPNVVREEKYATLLISAAIKEIDIAAVLDRKDVDDNPRVDSSLKHLNKFQTVYKLLRSAERDISIQEDNRGSIAFRNKAKMEIKRAEHRVALAAGKDVMDDLEHDKY